MKAAFVGVGTALAASACCLGPVAFSLIGAGALARIIHEVLPPAAGECVA